MRVRHRIPSIFNLSMVDVMCCALGCVILLWLINLREAKQHEESAEEQNRQIAVELTGIRTDRDKAYGMLMELETRKETLQVEKNDLQKRIATAQEEKNDLQKRLSVQLSEAAELSRRLKTSGERVAVLESDLRERVKRHETETARADALERRRKDAASRVASLENDLRASEQRGDKAMARGRELAEALASARLDLKEVQATANLVPALRGDLKEVRQQYAAERALANALEKEIAKRQRDLKDADKNLEGLQASQRVLERDLEGRDKELALARRSLAALREENKTLEITAARVREDNKTLENTAARVRTAAENRFAGIALTGRRVLFLVDRSGSMELVDENTKAPTKWADVRGTVTRLMRSLPDLQKYQVIVFAEKAAFLFEGEEDWLEYNPRSSPERVGNALANIAPKGGTNMYAALQTAFRLRAKGLDTIYLLSDGLPNLGEGVNADALNALKEVERNDLLARHIRRTLQTDWNRSRPAQPRVRINAIGFFYESPDVGAFLWALARENDGSFVGMSKP